MIITHTPCVTQPFDIYEKQSGIEQQGGKQTNQKKTKKMPLNPYSWLLT